MTVVFIYPPHRLRGRERADKRSEVCEAAGGNTPPLYSGEGEEVDTSHGEVSATERGRSSPVDSTIDGCFWRAYTYPYRSSIPAAPSRAHGTDRRIVRYFPLLGGRHHEVSQQVGSPQVAQPKQCFTRSVSAPRAHVSHVTSRHGGARFKFEPDE